MTQENQVPPAPEGGAPTPPPAWQAPPPAAPPTGYEQPPGGAPGASGRPGPASDTSKILAAIGYIVGLVAVIAILIEPYKNEPFVKFHAAQAIGIFLAQIVISFGAGIMAVVPAIGWMIAALLGLAGFVLFIYQIVLAIKAWGGEYMEVPVVYDLVKQYIGE